MSVPVRIESLYHDDPRFEHLLDFIYDVLYRPLGIDEHGPWRHIEGGAVHFVAIDGSDRIVGCARMAPIDETHVRQVRTVAVGFDQQGTGLGRRLMERLEKAAVDEGARELVLNARIPALGFYERLGFVVESDEFINPPSGLPHRRMRKRLFASA